MITIEYSGYIDNNGYIKNEFARKIYNDEELIADFTNEIISNIPSIISSELKPNDQFYIRTLDRNGNFIKLNRVTFDKYDKDKGVICLK